MYVLLYADVRISTPILSKKETLFSIVFAAAVLYVCIRPFYTSLLYIPLHAAGLCGPCCSAHNDNCCHPCWLENAQVDVVHVLQHVFLLKECTSHIR